MFYQKFMISKHHVWIGLGLVIAVALIPRKKPKNSIEPLSWYRWFTDSINAFGDRFKIFSYNIQQRGPIYWSSFLFIPTLMVTGKEGINKALELEKLGVLENAWPRSARLIMGEYALVVAHGKVHARLRRLTSTAFRPGLMEASVPQIEQVVEHYTNSLGENVDMTAFVKNCTSAIVFRVIFGLEDVTSSEFIETMKEWRVWFNIWMAGLFSFPIDLPGFAFRKSLEARERLILLLIPIINYQQSRYENSGRDPKYQTLMVVLKESELESKTLTEYELAEQALLLYFAGHDTSSSVLLNLFDFLHDNPAIRSKAIQEQISLQQESASIAKLKKMVYLEACINESLRMRPPTGVQFKQTMEDIEFMGNELKKGTLIRLSLLGSAIFLGDAHTPFDHYNPDRFLMPETTAEFESLFIPFGVGKHTCLGKGMAMNQIKMILSKCLLKYDWQNVGITKMKHFPSPTPFNMRMDFNKK